MSSLSSLVVAAEEVHRELPMPPLAYGLMALGAFVVLLGVTWSFRGTAQKVSGPHGHGGGGHLPAHDAPAGHGDGGHSTHHVPDPGSHYGGHGTAAGGGHHGGTRH